MPFALGEACRDELIRANSLGIKGRVKTMAQATAAGKWRIHDAETSRRDVEAGVSFTNIAKSTMSDYRHFSDIVLAISLVV